MRCAACVTSSHSEWRVLQRDAKGGRESSRRPRMVNFYTLQQQGWDAHIDLAKSACPLNHSLCSTERESCGLNGARTVSDSSKEGGIVVHKLWQFNRWNQGCNAEHEMYIQQATTKRSQCAVSRATGRRKSVVHASKHLCTCIPAAPSAPLLQVRGKVRLTEAPARSDTIRSSRRVRHTSCTCEPGFLSEQCSVSDRQ
jgi:hypothetical protein